MAATFEENGVRFRFPENWTLERGEHDAGWSISVESNDTAFLVVSFHADAEDAAALADAALETLREEYPTLESEPRTETIAGVPAIGHDASFFSFDLTNSAFLRAFACEEGAVVILGQITDLELPKNGEVLRAIVQSMEIDD